MLLPIDLSLLSALKYPTARMIRYGKIIYVDIGTEMRNAGLSSATSVTSVTKPGQN